jgi:hypothetical protein
LSAPLSTEELSPIKLREIADCSPQRCHDALEWAADEIERLERENQEFRAQLDALNPRKKHPHGPDALVGALQDKVHEDNGPFRAGHSVKHDRDVGGSGV